MKKMKTKSITELTKGFEEFIKDKKLNPNHRKDFERVAKGKVVKNKEEKVRRAS